ncbi:DUF6804 family protein [Prosthecobacter sp.]|uniref:DUF6804 family protein n=1 Tax=Prosthecobacter sp. TaxID=1965333 RepID=UPI0024872ADC|nr:DUF6804 family protein [Prosthecobacter sp.]MDI1315614.1 hypothetical protein [Prosthecobacter sp.]
MNRAAFYIVAALCGIAMVTGMPYGYFMFLRLCVCAVSIYGAVQLSQRKAERMAWGCVALAVLFNPIFKVHLGRELWWIMDGVAGVFLCVVASNSNRQSP